ncbi:MAG: putative DNA binding domain-containing protein, partial [Tannerella sp.]|nr:putative DNA binding domain-containing protein [Tannerella sp.]
MTKEDFLKRLNDIEWDDFEAKEAQSDIPKNSWDTVSAFANTSGGWLVLGVKETKKGGQSTYSITGVRNAEKLEQDFVGVLRSQTKFNLPVGVTVKKYVIDGNTVLAFHIPSSPVKPVYFNNNIRNTYIRTGSGDQQATDMEILAIQRDQAFGSRSEQTVPGTSIKDLNRQSLETYRRRIQEYNAEFAYNNLDDEDFCKKLGITYNGNLGYGSLLMLGQRDAVQFHVRNFWIDYIEIPGTSYNDAAVRYTYRMPEQENLWEYYQVLIQRLRLYVDNPFTPGPDGFSPDDNSQLYALREGLINMLSHADFFSPMHSTIRVYDNRIEFQNPGRFYIDIHRLKEQVISMPRNPSIIKFFRYAKLSENAGYGIDKMLKWQELTGQEVAFETDLVSSTVTYFRPREEEKAEQKRRSVKRSEKAVRKSGQKTYNAVFALIKEKPTITREELSTRTGITQSTIQKHVKRLKDNGYIQREGSDKSGYWMV